MERQGWRRGCRHSDLTPHLKLNGKSPVKLVGDVATNRVVLKEGVEFLFSAQPIRRG